MSANIPDRSPDEQVYQSNKHEPEAKVVYSDESAENVRSDERGADVVSAADQDEISAESFPASDAPPTTVALPKKPGGESANNANNANEPG